jgi:hypothetical protein
MAQVHGEKTVASQMKSAVNAGAAKMMDSPMGKMGMGTMMNESMGPMMKEGMGSMMHEDAAPMMKEGMAKVMKTPKTPVVVGSGAASAVAAGTGKSVMGKFFTHPLVLFGLGVAVGYYLHKYRKSIISTSNEARQEE